MAFYFALIPTPQDKEIPNFVPEVVKQSPGGLKLPREKILDVRVLNCVDYPSTILVRRFFEIFFCGRPIFSQPCLVSATLEKRVPTPFLLSGAQIEQSIE